MKKSPLLLTLAFLLLTDNLYAANGDLIVNGKLGIGTSVPGSLLDVRYNGSINLYRASDSTGLYRWRVDQNFNQMMTNVSGVDTIQILNSGGINVLTGNVGIGTANPGTVPGYSFNSGQKGLHITGDGSASMYSTGLLMLTNNRATPTNGDQLGGILFDAANGPATAGNYSGIFGYSEGAGGSNGFGARLVFYTKADNGSGLIERMRITNTGNVGIGATNPLAPLTVYNPGTFNPVTAGTGSKTLTFGDVYTNNGWHAVGMCGGGNPTCLAAGGGNWWFGYQQDTNTMVSTAYLTSSGYLWIAGGLTQYSDLNIKADIQDLRDVLLRLKKTRAVNYRWKDPSKPQTRQIGVIAQELATVFPELVLDMPNPDCMDTTKECTMPTIKSVDYVKLSAVAIQGVKELSDKVDDLKKRIEKLEQLLSKQTTN